MAEAWSETEAEWRVPAVDGAQYLVFGGGGARGMAYVGYLAALAELCGADFGLVGSRARSRLRGVSGTSIGALFALLVTLAYSAAEVAEVLAGLRSDQFCAMDPLALILSGSADTGASLREMLADLIERKFGVRDMTMADLAARTGLDLVVVATDTTHAGAARYLRADTTPAQSVVACVYASMALVPFLPPVTLDGAELQDGGGCDNLPAGVWGEAASKHTLIACLTTASEVGMPTLGTLPAAPAVVSDEEDEDDTPAAPVAAPAATSKGILARVGRSVAALLAPMAAVRWALLTPDERAGATLIDAGVRTVELHLTPAIKERARSLGYAATATSLTRMRRHDAPTFVQTALLPAYLQPLFAAATVADDQFASAAKLADSAAKLADSAARLAQDAVALATKAVTEPPAAQVEPEPKVKSEAKPESWTDIIVKNTSIVFKPAGPSPIEVLHDSMLTLFEELATKDTAGNPLAGKPTATADKPTATADKPSTAKESSESDSRAEATHDARSKIKGRRRKF